jgi:hypothetical protein
MQLAAALIALAALAGNTVVTAAVTDAWESAREGFARLLGRGDPAKAKLAEQRLAETHDQLAEASGADLEGTRAALEAQWVTRMRDLLEEDPGVEADLRALVREVRSQLPPRPRSPHPFGNSPLGPNHPDTLMTRANLAHWAGEAGDPAAAQNLFAELLPVRERVSGPDHPDTLAVRANLARWTSSAAGGASTA